MTLVGTTFNIQQFSTEDGPGIRTTVFLKGCPLRCAWCHNPEGMRPQPELVWHDGRCIAARECLRLCPVQALALTPVGMVIDRQACTVCGLCAEACPAGALEVIGRQWTPEALFTEVAKDAVFFQTSHGGVTVSGGEPLLQVEFVEAFLRLCKGRGEASAGPADASPLHIALDTCGLAPWAHFQRLLPLVDLVLYDLKLVDTQAHRAACGADNALILENARRLAAAGKPLWIRTPIIPSYGEPPGVKGTAEAENIAAIGEFIRTQLPTVERWDLLAYTNLGKPKYHRLDRRYALEDVPLLTQAEMEALHAVAVAQVPVAVWSGATRP